MSYRYILGDTETTGPTTNDKAVEMAWMELNDSLEVVDRQHSLIDPQMKISSGASGVHGLTNVDVEDAPTIEEFFGEVLERPLDGDVILIAHNVVFDLRYYGPWIPTLAGTLCTLRLSRRVWPEAENHKLSTLMYELGLTRGQSHRASGDVETTYDLLRRIVDKTGKSLPELAAESMQPIVVKTMPFGKHKGAELKDVPMAYFDWLLKQGSVDRDLAYSIELLKAGKR